MESNAGDHLMKSLDDLIKEEKSQFKLKQKGKHQNRYNQSEFHQKAIYKNKGFQSERYQKNDK
jgi:hypothetical protein